LSTKIHATVDALGNPTGFHLTPGQAHDLEGADALAIVTEWKEFRSPDFSAIRAKLKSPVIFDGRNLYVPEEVAGYGLDYHPIGRAARRHPQPAD